MARKIIGIIPARFQSSRLPGKPLLEIGGRSIVERVFHQASRVLDEVWVATDDQSIYSHVQKFGQAVMTGAHHLSGTDRIQEAAQILNTNADYIINIQGDEPWIQPGQISELCSLLDGEVEIATQAREIDEREAGDPNVVKVVLNKKGEALYFSRSVIPFSRNEEVTRVIYQHVGIYAYRRDILDQISSLKPAMLEMSESLEQLRWMENGYRIRVKPTDYFSLGIDTQSDFEKAKQMYLSGKLID